MQALFELENKFRDNLDKFIKQGDDAYKEIDLKARAIAAVGQVASRDDGLQPHQTETALVFAEVFSDMVLSIYFTACALDKPAQSVLRRSLELGIAIVYIWDLPHVFWGWKTHDYDLNFNEMIEHLSKDSYKSFLASLDIQYTGGLFDYNEARRLYRVLSNTVHGKIATHESSIPDRFSHNTQDCRANLDLILRVQGVLLRLYENRFPDYFLEMSKIIPAINTIVYRQIYATT